MASAFTWFHAQIWIPASLALAVPDQSVAAAHQPPTVTQGLYPQIIQGRCQPEHAAVSFHPICTAFLPTGTRARKGKEDGARLSLASFQGAVGVHSSAYTDLEARRYC